MIRIGGGSRRKDLQRTLSGTELLPSSKSKNSSLLRFGSSKNAPKASCSERGLCRQQSLRHLSSNPDTPHALPGTYGFYSDMIHACATIQRMKGEPLDPQKLTGKPLQKTLLDFQCRTLPQHYKPRRTSLPSKTTTTTTTDNPNNEPSSPVENNKGLQTIQEGNDDDMDGSKVGRLGAALLKYMVWLHRQRRRRRRPVSGPQDDSTTTTSSSMSDEQQQQQQQQQQDIPNHFMMNQSVDHYSKDYIHVRKDSFASLNDLDIDNATTEPLQDIREEGQETKDDDFAQELASIEKVQYDPSRCQQEHETFRRILLEHEDDASKGTTPNDAPPDDDDDNESVESFYEYELGEMIYEFASFYNDQDIEYDQEVDGLIVSFPTPEERRELRELFVYHYPESGSYEWT